MYRQEDRYYENGYGIILQPENQNFRKDAAEKLVDEINNAPHELAAFLQHAFRDYCDEEGLDHNDSEAKKSFVEQFEDDQNCSKGIGALLALFLNLIKGASDNTMFAYVEGCLYYRAYIPGSELDRNTFLTREQIESVFAEVVNPLLNQPLPMKWLCVDNG